MKWRDDPHRILKDEIFEMLRRSNSLKHLTVKDAYEVIDELLLLLLDTDEPDEV